MHSFSRFSISNETSIYNNSTSHVTCHNRPEIILHRMPRVMTQLHLNLGLTPMPIASSKVYVSFSSLSSCCEVIQLQEAIKGSITMAALDGRPRCTMSKIMHLFIEVLVWNASWKTGGQSTNTEFLFSICYILLSQFTRMMA